MSRVTARSASYTSIPRTVRSSENFTTDFEELGGIVANQVSIEAEQTTYVPELQQCVGVDAQLLTKQQRGHDGL